MKRKMKKKEKRFNSQTKKITNGFTKSNTKKDA